VRISLAESKPKPQARPRRPIRRRRSNEYDSAIVQPAVQPVPRLRREEPASRQSTAEAQPEAGAWQTLGLAAALGALRRFLAARWWAVLLLAALVGAVAYVFVDGRFYVYTAEIQGASHLDPQAIYRAAGVDKQSIFWIDPEEVARSIIKLDGIRAVRVRCALPAGVTIEVEEREPVVLWRSLTGKRDWWLDLEGVVLPYHGDPTSEGVVFVVDSSELQLQVGGRIEPQGLMQSVHQLAEALPGARVFYYDADRGLSFTQLAGGGQWPVYVGTGEDLQYKIQVVDVLTNYLVEKSIRPEYVDVRWADRPLYGVPASKKEAGGN
jgi:hypothetical protein